MKALFLYSNSRIIQDFLSVDEGIDEVLRSSLQMSEIITGSSARTPKFLTPATLGCRCGVFVYIVENICHRRNALVPDRMASISG